jgi:hypothetical protein
MKLIIAGGRDIEQDTAYGLLVMHLRDPKNPLGDALEIVQGGCRGVDQAGKDYADFYDAKCTEFPADWNTHGRAAGPIRNKEMAEYADALCLLWDGKSRGSASMKREMEKLDKKVYEIILPK